MQSWRVEIIWCVCWYVYVPTQIDSALPVAGDGTGKSQFNSSMILTDVFLWLLLLF